jgi:hypothetical protein
MKKITKSKLRITVFISITIFILVAPILMLAGFNPLGIPMKKPINDQGQVLSAQEDIENVADADLSELSVLDIVALYFYLVIFVIVFLFFKLMAIISFWILAYIAAKIIILLTSVLAPTLSKCLQNWLSEEDDQ